jgi:hypothetical protein
MYVANLTACWKDPEAFFDVLTGPRHRHELKGVGPIKCHLVGDFGQDEDGTLSWGSKTHVKRMLKNYEQMFGELPKEFLTPLENFGKLWKRMTTLNTRHDPGIGH